MYKARISVLWLLSIVVEVVSIVFTIIERGLTEQVEGISNDSATLLAMSIILLVALIMVFLSLTLKDKANRWANIIMGMVFLVITLLHLIGTANQTAHTILLWGSSVVFKVLIVWYAYKWPKN